MGLFSRHSTEVIADVIAEHSIVIRIELPSGPGGTATDMASLAKLEERLKDAISQARAGEFDGHELAGGEVYFYAYGPDADRLLTAVQPVVRTFHSGSSQILLRYGPYHEASAEQVVVNI